MFALTLLLLALLPVPARAEPYGIYNRPGDHWLVSHTRYFKFYFTRETPRTAAYLMSFADQTFERLNRFYGYEPTRKITVTIVGYTDFANAFADSSRDHITVFTTPANFHSRSRTPWLDNVFTHELSHILSLNAASYWSSRVPLVIGTGVTRTDHTQSVIRLPFYGGNFPHWFKEGVAQFDTWRLGRDSYDENRRSYQRAALEDGLFFPLGKLAFYGREKWYNTGFSFLLYLEERFGEGSVHRLFREAGHRHNILFDDLFGDVLGVPLKTLELEYRAGVGRSFSEHVSRVDAGRYDGRPWVFEDQEYPYDELTPQQKEDLGSEYRARPMLYKNGRIYYRKGDLIRHARFDPKSLALSDDQALTEGFAFAPHTEKSYFVLRDEGHSPSLVPDFYRPDFESSSLFLVDDDGNERRMLRDSRLMDLDVCPSRRELAGVRNDGDGSLELVLYPLDGFGTDEVTVRTRGARRVLSPRPFDEVRTPRYSPDCKKLFFSRRIGDDHDIYYWDFETKRTERFAAEEAFELYPEPGERGVYYVSARDGTMSVYYRRYESKQVRRVTMPITSHHYPVRGPGGIFFSRQRSTGFQAYYQRFEEAAQRTFTAKDQKPEVPLPKPPPIESFSISDYSAVKPSNVQPPLFIPILDMVYEAPDGLGAQVGFDFYMADQLDKHSLWFRAMAGDRSSFWSTYRNDMTPVTLFARVGLSVSRNHYVFARSDGQDFDQVSDYRWGLIGAGAMTPLGNFFNVQLSADTLRDLGATTGARSRLFDVEHPRFARDRIGLSVAHYGLDRSDPTFRERVVNKRGYRQFDVGVDYSIEEVHPLLREFDPTLPSGRRPYWRAQADYSEFLALPELMRGFFDHTLQVDVQLGYITRDIVFLPFYGGALLQSLTSPELVNSVGFSGYSPYSIDGETLLSLGLSYRFPLFRSLAWDFGPFYLEDVYAQFFTSWGNIWGFDEDGRRQRPFVDRADNGRRVLGDVGADLRLLSFFHEIDANVGTTLRVAYRAVPFSACPEGDATVDPSCLGVNGSRGLVYYLMLGSGF